MADVNELSFGMLTLGAEGGKQCFVTRMDVKAGVTATLIRAACSFGYAKAIETEKFTVSANPISKFQEVKYFFTFTAPIRAHEFNYLKLTYITNTNSYYTIHYSNFSSRPIMSGSRMTRTLTAGNLAVPVFGQPVAQIIEETPIVSPTITPTPAAKTPFVLSPDANIAYIRYDGADKMGKALRSQYPELFDGCYDPEKAMKFIMEKVFPDKTLGTYIVSNFQYVENDHPVRAITLRTKNSEYIYNILKKRRQLCVKGTLRKTQNGGELVIRSIELVGSRNKLQNEGEYDLRIYHNSPEPKGNCLYDILANLIPLPELTNQNLLLWREYLEWKRKLSELRIKGAKYCAVRFEENPVEKIYYLRFLLAFPNKKEAELFKRALRREKMSVFENGYSEDRFQFKFNSKAQGAETGIELQCLSTDVKIHKSIPDYDWEEMLGSCAQYTDDRMPYIEIIQNINEQFAYEKCYMEVCFEVTSDTFTQNNVVIDWAEDNFADAMNTVLEQIPADGFIATTQVGDFALNSRLMKAIESLQREDHGTLSHWLFDITQARPAPMERVAELKVKWKNPDLNDSQKTAIKKMLLAPDVFLCQGPPGTGKTTVIAEAIYQWARSGYSVLLASQTHLAVNNALEKLLSKTYSDPCIRAIRLTNSRDIQRKIDESIESITEENVLENFYSMMKNHLEAKFLDKWDSDDAIIENARLDLEQVRKLIEERIKHRDNVSALDEEIKILLEALAEVEQDLSSLKKKNEKARKEAEQLSVLTGDLDLIKLAELDANTSTSAAVVDILKKNNALKTILDLGIVHLNEYTVSTLNARNVWDLLGALVCVQEFYRELVIFAENGCKDTTLEQLKANSKALLMKMAKDSSYAKEWSESKKAIIEYEQQRAEKRKNFVPSDFESDDSIFTNSATLTEISALVLNLINQMIEDCKNAFSNKAVSIDDEAENELVAMINGFKSQIDDKNIILESIKNQVLNLDNQITAIAAKYDCADVSDFLASIETKYQDACRTIEEDEPRKVLEKLIRGSYEYLGEAMGNMRAENANYLEDFVRACNVVGISCTENSRTLDNKGFKEFDVVIIDEVSKATPPELLMPMLRAKKVVLVGDHRQLPPLFNEHESSYEEAAHRAAENEDDEVRGILTMENFRKYRDMVTASLFKEYFNNASDSIKETLSVQYRMHSDIMQMVNLFYSGKLSSGVLETEEDVKNHGLTLYSRSGKVSLVSPEHHAYWVDSSEYHSIPRYESVPMGSTSFENKLEAHTIISLLRKIDNAYASANVSGPIDVGVINFYYSQVRLLNDLKKQDIKDNGSYKVIKVEINTVDRFQGKEKPIVIVSLVRNNKLGRAGDSSHIAAYQRINVAVSRAQKLLFIVGAKNMYIDQRVNLDDMDTGEQLPQTPIYRQIIESLRDKGCYLTADDILDNDYENN